MRNETNISCIELFKKNTVRFFIFFSCGLYSCNLSTRTNIDHPEHFDSVLRKAYQIDMVSSDLAMKYVDSAFNAFPDPGVGDLFRKYDYYGSYYSEIKRDLKKTMLYADSSLFIIENKKLEKEYAAYYVKTLFLKGDLLLEQKDYNNAINYYYKGKKILESMHDTCMFYQYSRRSALANYRKADYLKAVYYFKQSLRELDYCNAENGFERFRNQQAHLDDIALCYDKHGLTDSALYYFNEALSYIEKHESKFPLKKKFMEIARGVIYGNLGTTYYKIGNVKKAEEYFKRGIGINIKKDHPNEDAQITQSKLIRLYLETSRLDEARQLLNELRVSLNNKPSETVESRWHELQSEYYYKSRRYDSAYHYLKNYLILKDSIVANNKEMEGFNKEFESFENRYELELYRKAAELKNVYLIIAILFSIMISAIVILIWINWKRSRNHVLSLTKLNEQIQTQNAELQKALDSLEQSQRDNTRIMKVLAHDLRNPIGATINIADILLSEVHYSDEQKHLVELMKKSNQNSLEMINDLLYIDIDPESMKKEPVDMSKLLGYCVDILEYKARQKSQSILFVSDEKEMIIHVNREKMWRVLSNLIGNAIKFSPLGETIKIEMKRNNDMLRVSVKDNGIGIPNELGDKIFDMFSDVKRRGTANEQSFGLGLNIVRQIIQAHRGKIWFESEPEKGTTFFVELPIN